MCEETVRYLQYNQNKSKLISFFTFCLQCTPEVFKEIKHFIFCPLYKLQFTAHTKKDIFVTGNLVHFLKLVKGKPALSPKYFK